MKIPIAPFSAPLLVSASIANSVVDGQTVLEDIPGNWHVTIKTAKGDFDFASPGKASCPCVRGEQTDGELLGNLPLGITSQSGKVAAK